VLDVITPTPSLRYQLLRNNGTATMRIGGDLEEIGAIQLARACLDRGITGDLTLDLGGIEFADGTGTRMLATIHRAFENSGRHVRVANVPVCVQREVKALDLDTVLVILN
jgi:anti-anti-sigma regulatory factor